MLEYDGMALPLDTKADAFSILLDLQLLLAAIANKTKLHEIPIIWPAVRSLGENWNQVATMT